MEEDFERLPAQSRFVEICRIKNSQVNALASKVARCMASQCEEPEEIRSCFAYILGELIANVDQHSGGAGFLSAQHYPDKGSIHVAVGDCGVGIRRSFEGTHLEEQLRTPRAALEKALEPTVSSALLRPPSGPYQGRNNRGLGLSMISKLISETHGQFRLFTENAVYEQIGDVSFKFDETSHTHPGTLASLSINTDEITNFNEVIGEISNRVEPSELDEWDEMFESPKDELDSSP
ncbi:MAG: ATP-binding protein [Verrucomicrobiota bacterium JB023]|nr:ATP-binding protein [Verrucomicrobiota bacterium JB023]